MLDYENARAVNLALKQINSVNKNTITYNETETLEEVKTRLLKLLNGDEE